MKKIGIVLSLVFILSSCADGKKLNINGQEVWVEPYGWANKDTKYNENVIYEINFGNAFWSVVGFETIVIPLWLTGWEIYEPVEVKEEIKQNK